MTVQKSQIKIENVLQQTETEASDKETKKQERSNTKLHVDTTVIS